MDKQMNRLYLVSSILIHKGVYQTASADLQTITIHLVNLVNHANLVNLANVGAEGNWPIPDKNIQQ